MKKEHFFRVRAIGINSLNETVHAINKDFKESQERDFFAAKDAAMSYYRKFRKVGIAEFMFESEHLELTEDMERVDLVILLVEISSKGQEVEHPFVGNSELEKD